MQRGAIKQHGRFWVLKYREDVLQNGVKVRKDVYKKLAPVGGNYRTKESVQGLADVVLTPLNAGVQPAHSVDSLESFLDSFVAKGIGGRGRALRQSTVVSYKFSLSLARPHLPNIELRQVRTPHIDKVLRDVQAADGEEGRAQTAYQNLKNFLSSAFRHAVRYGLIDSNPVRDAAIPEGNKPDTHAYTLEEVHAIESTLKKPMAKAVVMVATFTGLRLEEIKGLRWEDYKSGVLNIRRGVVMGKIVDVKTEASKAPVPVVGIVKKVLADHLAHNSGDGYIFHGDTGEPVRFENLARRDIIPTLNKAGIEWHGFHAFRRGLATVLHDSKTADSLVIKHILRHSATDVTGKHYIKPSIERNRKALEEVEAKYKAIERKAKRKK